MTASSLIKDNTSLYMFIHEVVLKRNENTFPHVEH